MQLPHPHQYSGDRKELPNFISKVPCKLRGKNSHFSGNQHKFYDIYGYLKGNTQNQIQPLVQADKILWDNVEALFKIVEATLGDHNNVGTASTELD
jgi:hypothetical protein